MIERHLVPIVLVWKIRQPRKIQRHNEGRAGAFSEVRPAPFLSGRNDAEVESQFARDLRGAIIHQRAAGFEDHAHFFIGRRRERGQGRIELRRRAPLRSPGVVRLLERVMVRVKKDLAHCRDHAHDRSRIRALFATARVERYVLEQFRPEHHAIRIFIRQRHKRAGAAHHSPAGSDHGGGEAEFAHRRQDFFVGRIFFHRAKFRDHLADSHIGFHSGRAIESNAAAARRERGVSERFAVGRGHGRIGRGEGEVRFDKPGVDREAFHVPNARVGRHGNVFADRLDYSIANDDRAAIERFSGLHHHFAADERVNAERQRSKARRQQFTGGSGSEE